MADEEKKDYTESKNGFLDILARGGEGMIDGLAKSYPMVGGALQAMVGTQDYQDRVDARNYEREQREYGRRVMAEWNQNAQNRADAQKFEQEQRDEWRNNKGTRDAANEAAMKTAKAEGMKAEEFMSPEAQAARKTANETATEQNRLKLDLMDQQKFEERLVGMRKNLENELANNPMYSMMTFNERNAFLDSPAVRNMLEASGYMEDIMSMASGDKEAFDRLDRALNRQGWDLKRGEDGIMYLDMGYGNVLPATRESIEAINKQVHDAALEELNARSGISMTASLGDPARRNIAKYANAIMPYNNNSAAASLKAVQSVYNGASEEQKTWTFFNQALQDYADPNLPMSARMAGLQKCLPGLMSLGYSVEGFDPKAPSMDNVRILKLEEGFVPGKAYSFSQFADLCKSNDTISAQLDDMVARNQRQFGKDAVLEAMKNVKDTAKAAKGKEAEKTPEEIQNENVEKYRSDVKSMFEQNEDFWGLDDEAQDKVITAYENYERHKKGALESSKAKDVYGLPESAVRKLDATWKKETDGLFDDASTLNRSPVADVLDELETARKQYSDAKKEYEKVERTDLIRPSYHYMTPDPKYGKKIPDDLRLKKGYSSVEEELNDLKKKCEKISSLLKK